MRPTLYAFAVGDAGPDDPEFRTAMRDYTRWAVANVLAHAEIDDVPAVAPMRRWGWGGLQSS